MHELLLGLAGMWSPPVARWNGRWFDPPARAAWEVVLGATGAAFYLTVPRAWAKVTGKQIGVVWPRAEVEATADPLDGVRPVAIRRLELKQHPMFGLKVDRRTLGILPSLLETIRLLTSDDRVLVQVLLAPTGPEWWRGAEAAYAAFRRGRVPRRLRLDHRTLADYALRGVTYGVLEACGIVQELLTGKAPEPVDLDAAGKAAAWREAPLATSPPEKFRQDAFDVTIRVAVQAESTPSARALLRSVVLAFRVLDGDNGLEEVLEPLGGWEKMISRTPPFKLTPDYLSIRELTMITVLPTAPLQAEYRLTAVEHRESHLPAAVTARGLRLGTARCKGREVPVYLPTDNLDELCLPHVCIGMMGCGKTRGFAANLAVQAVHAGMGAIVIDPARGEIGDEVESVLAPDLVHRVRFGRRPVGLDWREIHHGGRARNRLANELIAFCEAASDEAGAQTMRFLRAAAKAIPSGRLTEVAALLTDRQQAMAMLAQMRAQERAVWTAFWDDKQTTPARRTQIAMPVVNRLDAILGDDYLAECVTARDGVDLVRLLDRPRVIILDIPAGDLSREAVDVLAALMATKIDLAMVLRRSQHPVFVIQDEPHQYMRSSRTWRAAAVEARKWRFSYVWLFHSWAQLPRDLAEIIKAAGPHLHLYASSKETFRALQEEIAPWTVEDALRIPRFHALHVVRAGGQTVPPFLAKMDPPPSGHSSPATHSPPARDMPPSRHVPPPRRLLPSGPKGG